jgi:hypothetical protein
MTKGTVDDDHGSSGKDAPAPQRRGARGRRRLGDLWRAADLVREHRGDSHVITWAVGGVDAVEVLLLTEQWWGSPLARTPRRGAGPTPTWTPGSSSADS